MEPGFLLIPARERVLLNSHLVFFCYIQPFCLLVYTIFPALCLIQTSSVKAAVSYSGSNSVRETLQTHFPKETRNPYPCKPRGCRAMGATCRPAGAAPLPSWILLPYLLDNTSFFCCRFCCFSPLRIISVFSKSWFV